MTNEKILRILWSLRSGERFDFFKLGRELMCGRSGGVIKKKIRSVETVVCRIRQIEPEDLKSQSRKKELKDTRFIIWYFLKKRYPWITSREASAYYNRKSHATVLSGVKKVYDRIETNRAFRTKIQIIDNELGF